ncbi:MAG: GNAT family N-acetyltransferase [Candidatus Pacearchaeota archaeon]
MKLETKRLVLRELKDSDAKCLVENLNDLEVSKNLHSIPYPFSDIDAKLKIDYAKNEIKKDRENYELGIEYKGQLIGIVSLHMLNKIQGNCFLDYWIGKKYWRKGIIFEATSALIIFGFTKLQLKTIESAPFADNIASKKLLEKLGFKKRFFISKKDKSNADNKVHDVQTYILTKEGWVE